MNDRRPTPALRGTHIAGAPRASSRRWPRRRLALWGTLAAVGGLFLAVFWQVSGSLAEPAPRRVGPPPVDLGLRAATLDSRSGSRLAAWHAMPDAATAVVVLAHPLRGDRRAMLGRARLFLEAGYGVVLADFQAHGESPGERITFGWLERHDVAAAVAFVRRERPAVRVAVVGWSLGGAAALLADDLNLDALVLEAVYPTLEEAVRNRVALRLGPLGRVATPVLLAQLPLRMGFSAQDLRPLDALARIDCPVLIAAGADDPLTTLAEAQRMHAAARGPKELIEFAGAGHVDLFSHAPERYAAQVLPFLAKHLAAPLVEAHAAPR